MARKELTLSTKANYGNWVPANIMKMLGAADSVLAVLTFRFPAETGSLGHWHSLPDFLRLYLLYVALPASF